MTNTERLEVCHVYHFFDEVAISLGFRYLTPLEARQIAAALVAVADDVEQKNFKEATGGKIRIYKEETGK